MDQQRLQTVQTGNREFETLIPRNSSSSLLQMAQKECHAPSDSPTLSEESNRTPVSQFNLGIADGTPGEDEITMTSSSNGGIDIQTHSPSTHLPSSDFVDGSPREDQFSITNSSNGGLDIRGHSPVIHSPSDPRDIPKNNVTTLMLVGAGEEGSFIVDSGATIHATGNRKRLSQLTTDKAGILVKTANGYFLRSHGCGYVISEDYTLAKVHYVPGLDTNVVSLSELVDLDYSLVFTRNNGCSIIDDRTNNLVGKGIRGVSGLFELDFLRVPLDRTRSETEK